MQVYSIDNEKWDVIVKSFKSYDVYYLSGYVKAFQINGDGMPQLLYFENDKIRAINVIMKRDISNMKYFQNILQEGEFFDITTPYGYGGWIVETKNEAQSFDQEDLKNDYLNFCREHSIVCEFVRFHPLIENWELVDDIYEVSCWGKTVYMDTSTEKVIWENISSKNRNMIRKAQKSGLKVYWCRDPRIVQTFMEIYNETMKRDEAEQYYYFQSPFYESILEDLKENAMWFYTMINGEIAAISIFLFCNGKMHYHLSASQSQYRKLAPTNLLLYEAAMWAWQNGYKKLHMGGGLGAKQDSLYKFKKAFNRQDDSEFYIGKCIFDHSSYKKLCELREEVDKDFNKDTSFFPAYRM